MQFQISYFGLFCALFFIAVYTLLKLISKKNKQNPSVWYSNIESVSLQEETLKIKCLFLPSFLKSIVVFCLACALCNPVILKPIQKNNPNNNLSQANPQNDEDFENHRIPSEGLAIFFILDQSGSMREEVNLQLQGLGRQRLSRIEALKFFTTQFIKGNESLGLLGRRDDLIGLISFARVPKVMAPLTLDHKALLDQLSEFNTVVHPKEEGTAIGYAIYKTAHTIAATEHFSKELLGEDKPAYNIKSTVMLLVTDGLQNPYPADMGHPVRSIGIEEAAKFAKEKGIRLYIVNIQPAIDFPGLSKEREVQKRAARLTGGEFFLASDAQALHQIYKVIDGLERSKQYGTNHQLMAVEEIPKHLKNQYDIIKLAKYLMIIALTLLFAAIILETTLLQKVP